MGQTIFKEKKDDLDLFKNPWRYWFPLKGPSVTRASVGKKSNVKFNLKPEDRKIHKPREKDEPIRPMRRIRFVCFYMALNKMSTNHMTAAVYRNRNIFNQITNGRV